MISDDPRNGGAGDDSLSGDTGADTFASIGAGLPAAETDHDFISNFGFDDTIDLDALFDFLDPTGASSLDIATATTGDFGVGTGADDTKITVSDASGDAVTDFSIILEDYSAAVDIDPGDNGSV